MDSIHAFLTEQVRVCRAKAAALQADLRCDEAVFEKIRANVFEIFVSVLEASRKTDDPMTFFLGRLEAIPASWQAAWERAEAHGGELRAHTEAVKLETVRAIRERLGVDA